MQFDQLKRREFVTLLGGAVDPLAEVLHPNLLYCTTSQPIADMARWEVL